jgi:hypothetical protein
MDDFTAYRPKIRALANHAWNNLNFAQSILHSSGLTKQAEDLIEEAKELCDRIVHSDKAGEFAGRLDGALVKPSETEVCSVCGEAIDDWVDPEWAKGHVCFSCDVNHDTDVRTMNAVEAVVRPLRRQVALTPTEAADKYGDIFNRLSVLDRKDGQHLCYCCNAPATGRSSMNIWGTVYDFETCDACDDKYDGKSADVLPQPKENPCDR